jgi:hypothetical protein
LAKQASSEQADHSRSRKDESDLHGPSKSSPRQRAGFKLHDPGRKQIELTARQFVLAEAPSSTTFDRLFGMEIKKVTAASQRLNEIVNDRPLASAIITERRQPSCE